MIPSGSPHTGRLHPEANTWAWGTVEGQSCAPHKGYLLLNASAQELHPQSAASSYWPLLSPQNDQASINSHVREREEEKQKAGRSEAPRTSCHQRQDSRAQTLQVTPPRRRKTFKATALWDYISAHFRSTASGLHLAHLSSG